MLVKPSDIKINESKKEDIESGVISSNTDFNIFKGKPFDILAKKEVRVPEPNEAIHFVTNGDFSMAECLIYLLKLLGPSDIIIATWSISELALRQLLILKEKGVVRTCKFIVDPRVKVRNPKPLQLLQQNFPYAMVACHAKVSLIQSDNHFIDIISSANLSRNPRIERGIIYNDEKIYNFDKQWIDNAFNRGTTTGN